MKKTIWKYELQVIDQQEVELPAGSEILTVQIQNEIPFLWALVDPKREKVKRIIEIIGTGHPIIFHEDDYREYISTISLLNGKFIGHVFEFYVEK